MAKRSRKNAARTRPKERQKGATSKGGPRKRVKSKGARATKSRTRTRSVKARRAPSTGTAMPPRSKTRSVEIAERAIAAPSGLDECSLWRRRTFRTRIFEAVAEWSREEVATLSPAMTLASLAKDTPWNQGQQNRLLQATNAARPFQPFDSTMNAPPGLAAGATTVDQWEQLAWDRQTPRTPCFGLA